MSNRSLPGWWIPAAIVAVGLVATALLVQVTWSQDRERQRAEAFRNAQALEAGLQSGLDRLEDRIRSLGGLMSGTRGYSPAVLARYDSLVRVEGPAPWRAFAVGPLLRRVDRDAVTAVVDVLRSEYDALDYPAFSLFPEASDFPEMAPIVMVQPATSRERVFGFDMASEANRRRAILAAVNSGLVELSTPVMLSQDGPDQEPSLLLVTAFRREPSPSPDPLDPWNALPDSVGVVATSFTPASLVQGTLQRLALDETRLNVTLTRDGEALLSFPVAGDRATDAEGVPVRLEARGATHQWIVEGSLQPWGPMPDTVWGALLAGLLITGLTLALHFRERAARFRLAEELDRQRRDLRASEARAAQYQRSEALGRLTGGIAHDFNNLLSVILGNLDLLRSRVSGGDGAEALVEQAENAANRAALLTRRLLTFGRQARLAPKVVDVGALLREMEPLLRTSVPENIGLEIVEPGETARIRADLVQLESALLNLVVNARDACRGGDTIRVTAGRMAGGGGHDAPETGPRVAITVEDTGCGMDAETLQRASDPFFTTKPVGKGSGLGLATTAGFVQQSGGELFLDSEVGRGTIVRIVLPEAPEADDPPPENPEPTGSPRALEGRRVLLVEDEEGVRRVMATGLSRAGAEVVTAGTGSEALRLLESGPRPDLVLTDQVMPGSTPGTEVVRQARSRGIPTILMSGYAGDELERAPVRPDLFLQKPVRLSALIPEVARLAGDRRAD